jgi:hypothetical protein
MKTKSKIRKTPTNKNKRLKKSIKIKSKSCDDFCKNVYVYELDKQNRKIAESSNIIYNPKLYGDFRMNTCKNNFCNKDCKKHISIMTHRVKNFLKKYEK